MKGVYSFGEPLAYEFHGLPVMVVGEGAAACLEALRLTEKTTRVYLLTRRESLLVDEDIQRKVLENTFINVFYFTELVRLEGEKDLEGVVIRDIRFGSSLTRTIPLDVCYVDESVRQEKIGNRLGVTRYKHGSDS